MNRVKFFSNYCSTRELTERCLKNYYFSTSYHFQIVEDSDYDIAIVFNFTRESLKPDCILITIIQEPSWYFGNASNPFLSCSNLVVLHDSELFPGARNVSEIPSLMFYTDQEHFSFFKDASFPKSNRISFILSNKNMCEGHQKRLNFLSKVLDSDLDIDIFGRGIETCDSRYKGELPFKYDGLISYEYSICIENSVEKNYITEKFIDCVICDTIPLYYGAPNISDIYDERGFLKLDINSENVIHEIKYLISTPYHAYKKYNEINKQYYFSEFNLFRLINEILN